MREVLPWKFAHSIDLSKLRDKKARVAIYPTADHCFYTPYFGTVPTVRVTSSKESRDDSNPANGCVASVVDLDAAVEASTLFATLELIPDPYKPRFVEKTLSGYWRLVLPFEVPLVWGVPKPDALWEAFHRLYLKESNLETLFQGMDVKAFKNPAQIYFNHCDWMDAGEGFALPRAKLMKLARESFSAVSGKSKISAGRLSDWKEADAELRRRFPRFDAEWKSGDFKEGAQGSSFWVEGSKSPMSAIAKAEGMLSWSAHADQMFYTWDRLLGAGFIEKDHENRDEEIFDTYFFNDAEGGYYKYREGRGRAWMAQKESHVKVDLQLQGLSTIVDKEETIKVSELDRYMVDIRNRNCVSGVGPFMFHEERRVEISGDTYLNGFSRNPPILAAPSRSEWGPNGKFPNLSRLLESRFEQGAMDLPVLLSYLKVAYSGVLQKKKQVKQGIIMVGETQTGKTWINTGLIPALVGGFAEGSKYLTGGTSFTGNLFDYPHIAIDDAEMSASVSTHKLYTERIKALVSKANVMVEEKFKSVGMGFWYGTTGVTANCDFGSIMSALPDLTLSINDKLIIVQFVGKAIEECEIELKAIMQKELPHFARWLLDFEIPQELRSKGRYELEPWKNPHVIDEFAQHADYYLAAQVLVRAAVFWFAQEENKAAKEFHGNHLALYEMVNSSTPTLGREWTQKRLIGKLRETISNLKGCDWLSYSKADEEWTIVKENLPKLRS
jgi:hypothetical protein